MSFSCSSKFYLWIEDFPSFQDNDIILDFLLIWQQNKVWKQDHNIMLT